MSKPAVTTPVQTYARIAGAIYVAIVAIGLFGESFVRQRLIVAGDATATATNIATSSSLWQGSLTAELTYLVGAVVSTWIFYLLLRPVNKDLAGLAVLLNVVSIALEAANKMTLIAASLLLENTGYLQAFEPKQLHAMAYFAIEMYQYGFGISLMFFAGWCVVCGHMIRRSTYLPAILGVGLQIAGVCYMTNSLALLAAPALASMLFPYILLPAFVAESSLSLWLLIKGIDVRKWAEQESRADSRVLAVQAAD